MENNIYKILPTLKNRVDMCQKRRYIIVFINKKERTYYFDVDDCYSWYIRNNYDCLDIAVAFRKSGKVIFYQSFSEGS